MSTPEDRGEPGRGRARYGPPPDFTLPPDTIGTLPGDDAPAQRPNRPGPGPADSSWFTTPAESPQPYGDRASRDAPGPPGAAQPGGSAPSREDTQRYRLPQSGAAARSSGDPQSYGDPRSNGGPQPDQAPGSPDPG